MGHEEDWTKYKDKTITFVPKQCPTCKELLTIRELGVWGYYCVPCMFWWGTYDPFPKVEGSAGEKKAEEPKDVPVEHASHHEHGEHSHEPLAQKSTELNVKIAPSSKKH